MNETGPVAKAPREAQCKQARPHEELVAEILDSRRLKTEREHAAAKEIDKLRQLLRAEGAHLENVKAAWQAKVDALGLAIVNANYPWTPEMRAAYEMLPDAKVGAGGTAEQKYDELLFAVGRKFRDESRHETALRYIREAEAAEKVCSGDTAAAVGRGM